MSEILKLESAPKKGKEEVIDLFSLGDRVFTVPKKPRVNIALKYLRDVRKMGEAVAAGGLLESMLGPEGFEALCEFEDLTADQLQQVTESAARLALGALEDVQGNGSSGPSKSAG